MLRARLFASLLLALFLVLSGCADEGDESNTDDTRTASDVTGQDTTVGTDTHTAQDTLTGQDTTPGEDTTVAEDTRVPEDTTAEDTTGADTTAEDTMVEDTTPEDVAPPTCDREGFTVEAQLAEGELGFVDYVAANGTVLPVDRLSIETLYETLPALPYGFSFENENYAECETCVTIRTDITDQACDPPGCVQKLFLAYAGELEVTTWDVPGTGSRFTGTLTNIWAHEVTLDPDPMNFTSTPVEGGEHWCIDSMSFDAELTAW